MAQRTSAEQEFLVRNQPDNSDNSVYREEERRERRYKSQMHTLFILFTASVFFPPLFVIFIIYEMYMITHEL